MDRSTENWSPISWQSKEAAQQPVYPSREALDSVLEELRHLPPLVTSWEVEQLKAQLAQAASGQRFVLQGGDCAEQFASCNASTITNKLKILMQMSLVLVHGLQQPVVRIGRFAGQYAKPRSAATETRNNITLPSYRGDVINLADFTAAARTPDPSLMLRGYERSALTLNFVRSLTAGGFADLHHPENWDLEFMDRSPAANEYRQVVADVTKSIRFVEAVVGSDPESLHRVDFFSSHEGLLLPYEQAQTRQVPHRLGWYNLATHLPWIGARTGDLLGAHVEYFRGIRNPIAIKVGAEMEPEMLLALIDKLDPDREPGRLTLIHRFGAERIAECLPRLIKAVARHEYRPLWIADPMHGNTVTTAAGVKTRHFDQILAELRLGFAIHLESGSRLGGVHFELTGENVTECLGGARGLAADELGRDYQSQVDPRLNYEQAMEMAMLIVTTVTQS